MNVKALLDVDMVALEASDKVTLMLDLTAPQNAKHETRPGQAVQVVLDRSGSMNGQPLDAAKGSLLKLIDRLAPQDSFGLVAFDDSALVVAPNRTMADHHMPSLRKGQPCSSFQTVMQMLGRRILSSSQKSLLSRHPRKSQLQQLALAMGTTKPFLKL